MGFQVPCEDTNHEPKKSEGVNDWNSLYSLGDGDGGRNNTSMKDDTIEGEV